MRIFLNPYFIICATLSLILLICEGLGISFPWLIKDYAGDLLSVPVVLTPTLFILRIFKRDKNLLLSKTMILFAFAYFVVLFEFILPSYSSRYTQDYMDIAMYAIGTFIYHRSQDDWIAKMPTQ